MPDRKASQLRGHGVALLSSLHEVRLEFKNRRPRRLEILGKRLVLTLGRLELLNLLSQSLALLLRFEQSLLELGRLLRRFVPLDADLLQLALMRRRDAAEESGVRGLLLGGGFGMRGLECLEVGGVLV